MRRRSVLLMVLAAVVLSSVVTWVASEKIRSPAEAAARSAPPTPTPILVPVEEKVLVSKIVTRGTAKYRSPRTIRVAHSFLKSIPPVITRAARTGISVAEGEVLMSISGRPVFLLRGRQPSYRDLGPGMSGSDVEQLEAALERVGLDPGRVDGHYDSATGSAVATLYRRAGLSPAVADDATLAERRPPEAGLVEGARAFGGVQLPADEVVYVPDSPVRVNETLAGIGDAAKADLVTVTGTEVVVDGALPTDQARMVQDGTHVELDDQTRQLAAKGVVEHVAATPGTAGADGFHVAFRVRVISPDADLVGASLRITVPVETTGEAILAVPVSALSLGPDGGSRVRRSLDGRLSYVPVTPGLTADGFVAVTPTKGNLAPGDEVVIGFEPTSTAGG